MQRYRRLYHSSRCLFNSEFKPSVDLPRPLSAEPVIHPIGQTYPAIVSLQHTGPKVPPQKWQRESLLETATKRAGGKLRRGKLSVLGAPKKTIAERQLLSKGRVVNIPVPLPHAVHCVIGPIPSSFNADDVKRLVPYDKSTMKQHPVVEAKRIYEPKLKFTDRYFLRFSHGKHLKTFLNILPMKVNGREIQARLFRTEVDPFNLLPNTVVPRYKTPRESLSVRHRLLGDDVHSTTTHVLLTGVPIDGGSGISTNYIKAMGQSLNFEFAHPWTSQSEAGSSIERNAISLGRVSPETPKQILHYEELESKLSRWLIALKDQENAWRFAREMHLTYWRTLHYGNRFVIKAFVVD